MGGSKSKTYIRAENGIIASSRGELDIPEVIRGEPYEGIPDSRMARMLPPSDVSNQSLAARLGRRTEEKVRLARKSLASYGGKHRGSIGFRKRKRVVRRREEDAGRHLCEKVGGKARGRQ